MAKASVGKCETEVSTSGTTYKTKGCNRHYAFEQYEAKIIRNANSTANTINQKVSTHTG